MLRNGGRSSRSSGSGRNDEALSGYYAKSGCGPSLPSAASAAHGSHLGISCRHWGRRATAEFDPKATSAGGFPNRDLEIYGTVLFRLDVGRVDEGPAGNKRPGAGCHGNATTVGTVR